MTNAFRDPTGTGVISGRLSEVLDRLLWTLSPVERQVLMLRFGLADDASRTAVEVGEALGLSALEVREFEREGLRKLRHPSRSASIRDHADEVSPGALDRLRAAAIDQSGSAAIVRCPRHGWVDRYGNVRVCEACPCRVGTGEIGRPRRFCSAACRQAAYRDRRTIPAGH